MFSIVSWNVNSINSRLERVVNFLKTRQPDVLCLQELKCLEEKYPFEAIKAAGYESATFGQKAYNGVAILSKKKATKIECGFGDKVKDEQSRFIAGTVNGIRIMSAYVPNGQDIGTDKYKYKLKWLKRLRRHLDTNYKKTQKIVLVGDFNIAPEDRDCYAPDRWRGKILFSEPEKKALKEVMDFGLEDTFRLHHQEAGKYSWWDYRQLAFQKGRGLRIDFVLGTPPMIKLCTGAEINRDERKGIKPSDHAPVIAEFKI